MAHRQNQSEAVWIIFIPGRQREECDSIRRRNGLRRLILDDAMRCAAFRDAKVCHALPNGQDSNPNTRKVDIVFVIEQWESSSGSGIWPGTKIRQSCRSWILDRSRIDRGKAPCTEDMDRRVNAVSHMYGRALAGPSRTH